MWCHIKTSNQIELYQVKTLNYKENESFEESINIQFQIETTTTEDNIHNGKSVQSEKFVPLKWGRGKSYNVFREFGRGEKFL